MSFRVRHCILCGCNQLDSAENGGLTMVRCCGCDAAFTIELNPADAPNVRGRIEVISRRIGPVRTGPAQRLNHPGSRPEKL
jgi:hypothetical protein